MATRKDDSTDAQDAPAGANEIQQAVDDETEKGYRGVGVDPTPNEHYTVGGVTQGLPTPETDPQAATEARRAATGN